MSGKENEVVLYGAPVVGFVDELRARMSVEADIVTVDYHEPDDRVSVAFSAADVIVTNRFRRQQGTLDRLKLVQTPGAGLDEIDLSAVPMHIPVCNVYEHESGVAEYVFLAMLEYCWKLVQAEAGFRAGDWGRSSRFNGPPARELGGKTIGIVGLGRVGRAVARRARAFGMDVLAASRNVHTGCEVRRAYRLADLCDMLPHCDVVLVSCALTEETRDLIGLRELSIMKPAAFLINVSRGPVVEEEALFNALREGLIAGAQIDVWYRYPSPDDENQSPSKFDFAALQNAHMTPHIAGWTEDTVRKRWDFIAENVSAVLSGKSPRNNLRSEGTAPDAAATGEAR